MESSLEHTIYTWYSLPFRLSEGTLKPDGRHFHLSSYCRAHSDNLSHVLHTDIPSKYILLTNQHHHAREWLSGFRHEKIIFGPWQERQYYIFTIKRQYQAHMCIFGTLSLLRNWKLLICSQNFLLCILLLFWTCISTYNCSTNKEDTFEDAVMCAVGT
jgi:hypothetical protein